MLQWLGLTRRLSVAAVTSATAYFDHLIHHHSHPQWVFHYCTQIINSLKTMAKLGQGQEGPMSAHVLQQLSGTPYACSSLSQLSSRPGNLVYRGILTRPLNIKSEEAASRSVIIKYSTTLDVLRSVIMDLCHTAVLQVERRF